MQTTQQNLDALFTVLVSSYTAELATLPMKKNTRETLVDGFKDGARQGIYHVVKMLEVEVIKGGE